MKSVKIFTFCTNSSIGSILQSFALKKALKFNDFESEILLPKPIVRKSKPNFKKTIRNFLEVFSKNKVAKAYTKRNKFISDNIDVVYYNSYNELIELTNNDDTTCYLAGSDQIWNPKNCNPAFFLDFANGKKRISYAASMGETVIPEEKKERFVRMIQNFDSISVRESECADAISKFTDKNIETHIDPTFLIKQSEWKSREIEYKVKEPYILLYMIYWDKSVKKQVKKLQKKTGLKVYTIKNGFSRAYGNKMLYDVGIEEFLWLVDHAEYVVTSSFHGVAMSAIFNKRFSAAINPDSPSRIDNLMRVLSIPKVEIDRLDDTTDNFDYDTINARIDEERERGLKYLREAIG